MADKIGDPSKLLNPSDDAMGKKVPEVGSDAISGFVKKDQNLGGMTIPVAKNRSLDGDYQKIK